MLTFQGQIKDFLADFKDRGGDLLFSNLFCRILQKLERNIMGSWGWGACHRKRSEAKMSRKNLWRTVWVGEKKESTFFLHSCNFYLEPWGGWEMGAGRFLAKTY